MMMEEAKKTPVVSPDLQASFLAAFARIEAVPAGKTLIDEISEEDWHDASVAEWNICVSSMSVADADEADGFDAPVVAVA